MRFKMNVQVKSLASLIFLTIFNLCVSVENFAEKTLDSFKTPNTLSVSNVITTKRSETNPHQTSNSQTSVHQHNDAVENSSLLSLLNLNTSQQLFPFISIPKWGHSNFLLIDYLPDGEMERRISYKGITAKETSIGNDNSKKLSLWQLSNGNTFIQMIFEQTNKLIDCEFVRQKGIVNNFLHTFYDQFDDARSRNFSATLSSINGNFLSNEDSQNEILSNNGDAFGTKNVLYHEISRDTDVPQDMLDKLHYAEMKRQCDEKQKEVRQIVHDMNSDHEVRRKNATEHLERKKRSLDDWLIAPNTKWCGRGQSAGKYNQLGGASKTDKCCRRHDHCKFNIHALTTKWNLYNYRPFTISHCGCDMRHRRDLSNALRVPGTKWCGKGYSAKRYSEMGGYSKADRCCRQHDKSCPFWIGGFETKYGFFNWRVNTIMHCKCDERFRSCLKMADSTDAQMVGKLFFNYVQTKCFVIKPERICKKRSPWNKKCLEKTIRKRAHLRDNRKF